VNGMRVRVRLEAQEALEVDKEILKLGKRDG